MGSGGATVLLSPGRGWRVAGFGRSSAHALMGWEEEYHERLLQGQRAAEAKGFSKLIEET